jgi:spore coat protein U-like protein
MKKYLIAPVTAGIMLAVAGAAQADSKNASFTVSATVAKACTIDATDMNMGTWSGAGNLDGTTTVKVKCTNGTSYNVALDNGTYGTSTADRKLGDGSERLAYNLFRDAGRTQVWGSTIGTDTEPGTGAGMATANERSIDVHARIAEAQLLAAKPGTYTDSVTATITY